MVRGGDRQGQSGGWRGIPHWSRLPGSAIPGGDTVKIQQLRTWTVHIPYAAPVGPYVGRGGGSGTLGGTALIVRVDPDDGLTGWGEGTGQLEPSAVDAIVGRRADNIEGMQSALAAAGVGAGPGSGVEMALWDAIGKRAGLPLCSLLGGRVREEAEFTACMGLKEPSDSAATAREYLERWGFTSQKTKAGNDPDLDLRIAEAVVMEVGGQVEFRPDANSGYGPEGAFEQMRKMKDIGVNRFEDPCSGEHAEVLVRCRQEVGMEILINQGVAGPESVVTMLQAEAGDYLMPDTPAAGGVLPVQKVSRVAEGFGVPCLMHCSHDLGLKTVAITHLAASTPNFSGPSDTCYHGLVDDVLTEQLVFRGGKLAVPEAPGLGVEVDEQKLERYAL
jgi:L-alanine-DL-glutamate epimerase-like enolase superfamily enzyme